MIEIGAGGGSIARVDSLGLLRVGPDSRGRRPRTGLLRPRRHPADRHRRRPGARLPRPGLLPRRPDGARPRGRAHGDRRPRRGAARPVGRGGGLGHPPERQRVDGERRPRARAGARPRPARPAGVRVRRRRAGARLPGRARARRADADRAVRRRRDVDGRLPGRAAGVRLRALVAGAARHARLGPRRGACWPRWSARASRCWSRSGVAAATRSRTRGRPTCGTPARATRSASPWPATRGRRRPCAPRSRRSTSASTGGSARRASRSRPSPGACSRRARGRPSRWPSRGEAGDALKGERQAWHPELGGLTATPVYDRYRLAPGARIEGPAIVEERESTLVIGPGGSGVVDERWNLVVTVA